MARFADGKIEDVRRAGRARRRRQPRAGHRRLHRRGEEDSRHRHPRDRFAGEKIRRYRLVFGREPVVPWPNNWAASDIAFAQAALGEAEANLNTLGSSHMNLLATFAGLPALTLPAAIEANGLPLGVQLIDLGDGDDSLLATAAALEAAFGFRRPPLARLSA